MRRFVIDASVAIKWAVAEAGTEQALMLVAKCRLIAPELMIAEFGNVLRTKIHRGEFERHDIDKAVSMLSGAGVEFRPMLPLLGATVRIADRLQHPAYDCIYLALAQAENCAFVTADERFLRKLASHSDRDYAAACLSLAQAAQG